MNETKHISKNITETVKIAETIAKQINNGGVVLLNGDLGTGKTFIAKAITKKLKVNNQIVKSPTYTYIQKYKTQKNDIYHIDLYRIDKFDELLANEIIELTENENNIILIEWPERLFTEHNFFEPISINLIYISENKREITIKH